METACILEEHFIVHNFYKRETRREDNTCHRVTCELAQTITKMYWIVHSDYSLDS